MTEIHLSDEHKAFIQEQIESGRFKDANDVVSVAFELLKQADDKFRSLLQEGLDDMEAGRVHRYDDAEEFLADIKRLSTSAPLKTGTGH